MVVMHVGVAKAASFLLHSIILQQRTIQKGSILLSHQIGCFLKDAKKKGKMGWILKNEYPFIIDSGATTQPHHLHLSECFKEQGITQ